MTTKTSDAAKPVEISEPTVITATQLARSLSDVLSRVRYQGERFVVKRNGETVATLEPPEPNPKRWLSRDEFLQVLRTARQPDDEYWDDVERIHDSQPFAESREWPD